MRPAQDELHRRSVRLPGYDYAQPGTYFVTVVTYARGFLLGRIENGEIVLSKLGEVAQQQWEKLPMRFPRVELGAFVIMPNHLHGIIVIHDRRGTAGCAQDSDDGSFRRAPTEEFAKPVPGSIPTIVRSYEAAVTYRIHLMRGQVRSPVWQRNYYEHIIRDDKDWDRNPPVHRIKSGYVGGRPRKSFDHSVKAGRRI